MKNVYNSHIPILHPVSSIIRFCNRIYKRPIKNINSYVRVSLRSTFCQIAVYVNYNDNSGNANSKKKKMERGEISSAVYKNKKIYTPT